MRTQADRLAEAARAQQMTEQALERIRERQAQAYDQRHGGAYDRGQADSYYGRDSWPHYFVGDTHNSRRVDQEQMTAQEIAAYTAGYRDNEASGDRKVW